MNQTHIKTSPAGASPKNQSEACKAPSFVNGGDINALAFVKMGCANASSFAKREYTKTSPLVKRVCTKTSSFGKGGLKGIYSVKAQLCGIKSPLAPLLQGGGSAEQRDSEAHTAAYLAKTGCTNASPTAAHFSQEAYIETPSLEQEAYSNAPTLAKRGHTNASPFEKRVSTKTSPFGKGGLRGICHPGARQQGVALVVALVLLVVVTLVGLAAIRGTSLQEKMVGNMVDRAQAFQLTEGAIDLAARTVVLATPGPVASNYTGSIDCTSTSCADNPAIAIPNDPNWVVIPVSSSSNSATTNLVSLYGNNPAYLVQYMGSCSATGGGKFQFTNDQNNQGGGGSLAPASQCYRITARSGSAGSDRSQIVLQAIYRVS